MLSDEPIAALLTGEGNQVAADPKRATLIADFEADDYGDWMADSVEPSLLLQRRAVPGRDAGDLRSLVHDAVRQHRTRRSKYWKSNYAELRRRSEMFRDAFYETTLPPEVIEAVAANLTILKSPTVLRQHDGRLWCWEGCSDDHGCCAGSCTHVWNYAQAICHLFPSLERSLRRTEYYESQDAERPAGVSRQPADRGGRRRLRRLRRPARRHHESLSRVADLRRQANGSPRIWPRIRQSLDYMIAKYDPRHTGLLEEEHHNTYDINYFGPTATAAASTSERWPPPIKMGEAMDDDVQLYRELLDKGRQRMESELYNGEYFIQIVTERRARPELPTHQSASIRARRIATWPRPSTGQGPKYQYGTGCLSDGVLGLWMAAVCGLDDEIVDPEKVRSHLLAVHKYNLKHDLSTHANPQRPTFAMGDDGGLLLCSWPRGGKPLLPFVYSDEVWTGIEYQVASHLMMLGCVEEGLDIVRDCRRRYDGVRRNPFNEYECGHWYARAMSSYGLLQGLTGVRYDAVTKTLYVASQGRRLPQPAEHRDRLRTGGAEGRPGVGPRPMGRHPCRKNHRRRSSERTRPVPSGKSPSKNCPGLGVSIHEPRKNLSQRRGDTEKMGTVYSPVSVENRRTTGRI